MFSYEKMKFYKYYTLFLYSRYIFPILALKIECNFVVLINKLSHVQCR